jgi:hypothetical protein
MKKYFIIILFILTACGNNELGPISIIEKTNIPKPENNFMILKSGFTSFFGDISEIYFLKISIKDYNNIKRNIENANGYTKHLKDSFNLYKAYEELLKVGFRSNKMLEYIAFYYDSTYYYKEYISRDNAEVTIKLRKDTILYIFYEK